jgi:hypothetical protein
MKDRIKFVALSFLMALVIAVLLSCGGQGPNPAVVKVAKTAKTAKESSKKSEPTESVVEPAPPVNKWASFEKRRFEAQVMGKELILKILKNPDDANFPWFGVDTAFVPPCFLVTGKVEAKNDFGAVLTKRFEVCLQCGLKDNSITPKFVVFDGKTVYMNKQLEQEEEDDRKAAEVAREQKQEELRREAEAEMKARKVREQRQFEQAHPNEAARKKFAGTLSNARSLVKARVYPPARKILQRIIDEAPGTEIAAEAKQVLESVPTPP